MTSSDNSDQRVSLAMVEGEVALVFWRPEDFEEALAAHRDTGLPITTTYTVAADLGFHPGIYGPNRLPPADVSDGG